MRHDLLQGIWRLSDPKISLASFAAMFLGACAAASIVPLNWNWLILTVMGIFAIEVAKNASGEVFDFDSGVDQKVAAADRTPFSGGKRVLVDGLLTRDETIAIAYIGYAIGIFIGMGIAALCSPVIFWIGIAGVFLAYEYHGPPLKLSYRGLGELAVGICYGPLIVIGTYLVQVPFLPLVVLFASVPLGLLIASFLWVNEFPDFEADRSAGKQTMVVRFGRDRAARWFVGIQLAALAMIALLPLFRFSPWLILGEIGLVTAIPAMVKMLKKPQATREYIPVQKLTLATFVLVAFGLGVGFLLSGEHYLTN